jgi:hypothetical protein
MELKDIQQPPQWIMEFRRSDGQPIETFFGPRPLVRVSVYGWEDRRRRESAARAAGYEVTFQSF